MILGGLVGIFVFCKFPHYRTGADPDSYIQFKAMLISLSLHMILLMFEILLCDNLSSGRHLWIIVFIPLIFGSIASIRACVWSVKHDRSFELELFLAVNALQFVALPLKLDNFVNWNWEVVFVPMWIVVCLCLVSKLQTNFQHKIDKHFLIQLFSKHNTKNYNRFTDNNPLSQVENTFSTNTRFSVPVKMNVYPISNFYRMKPFIFE